MKAQEYLLQIPMWAKKKNTGKDIQAFLEVMGRPEIGRASCRERV